MPIDSKIIYGNKIISGGPHTTFLGLVIDNILAWNNHIEEIMFCLLYLYLFNHIRPTQL